MSSNDHPRDEHGNSTDDDTPADGAGDSETTSTRVRYPFTNDLLAGLLVVALVGTIAAALYTGRQLPANVWRTFIAVVALAAVWAFGTQTVDAVGKLLSVIFRGGNNGGGNQ